MQLSYRFISLLALVSAASAQSLIPSNWRKPTVTQTRAERIKIAQSAIDLFNSYYVAETGRYNFSSTFNGDIGLDDTFVDHNDTLEWARHGASGLRYTAQHDLIANTKIYESFVTSALQKALDVNARTIFGAPMDNLMTETFEQFGLAAVHAHDAYGNLDMLSLANTVLSIIDDYKLTNQGAGYPGAEIALVKCLPYNGGEFYPYLSGKPSPSSHLQQYGWIQSTDWTGYFALSSYIAKATNASNAVGDAAETYDILKSFTGLIRESDSFEHAIYVYNATAAAKSDIAQGYREDHKFENCKGYDSRSPVGGSLVEAYSVYGALTSSPTVNQRLINAVGSSTSFGLSEDGILIARVMPTLPGRGGHLAGFVDPLLHTTNETLRAYIQAYANVQFNALQDYAKNPTEGSYSQIWVEHDTYGYGQYFNMYYHLETIPALNLAIGRTDEA